MSGCRAVYLDHVDLGASAGGQLSSQFSHLYLETLSREYNMPCSKSLFVDQFCAILAGEMGSTLTTSVYVAIRSVRVCPYVDPENWCKYLIWLHISLTLCRKNKSAQKRFSIFQNKKMQKKTRSRNIRPRMGVLSLCGCTMHVLTCSLHQDVRWNWCSQGRIHWWF